MRDALGFLALGGKGVRKLLIEGHREAKRGQRSRSLRGRSEKVREGGLLREGGTCPSS